MNKPSLVTAFISTKTISVDALTISLLRGSPFPITSGVPYLSLSSKLSHEWYFAFAIIFLSLLVTILSPHFSAFA